MIVARSLTYEHYKEEHTVLVSGLTLKGSGVWYTNHDQNCDFDGFGG